MKVNGYRIREAVRRWTTAQSVAAKMFPEVMYAFKGEQKDAPADIDRSFWEASLAVVELQVIQQYYNSKIVVNVGKETMSLSKAIKLVAFSGQRSKMWKTSALETGRSRYSDRAMTRSAEDEVAKRQVNVRDCLTKQTEIDKYLSELRTAIAIGNGQELDIEIMVREGLI